MTEPHPAPPTKAVGIHGQRGLIDERGAAVDQQLSLALGPADHQVFRHALAVSWVPVETTVRIYEACGRILFPAEKDVLFEVGLGMAKANMSTIYKAFMRVSTVPYVLSQAARLWGTYHAVGTATASQVEGANEVVFVVRDYPACPPVMRRTLRGYVAGLAEMVGIRSPRVALDESVPAAWKWTITWT